MADKKATKRKPTARERRIDPTMGAAGSKRPDMIEKAKRDRQTTDSNN